MEIISPIFLPLQRDAACICTNKALEQRVIALRIEKESVTRYLADSRRVARTRVRRQLWI